MQHLEGLLHLTALTFAMSVAYLGVDKVGDGARKRLENEFSEALSEVRKRVISATQLIQHEGKENKLSGVVGEKYRLSMCTLFSLCENIQHDLFKSKAEQRAHQRKLFWSFRCFVAHWDLRIVAMGAAAAGIVLLCLVCAATFEIPVHANLLVGIIALDVCVIALVVIAAYGVGSATDRLKATCTACFADFDQWLADIGRKDLRNADEVASKPIGE